MTDGQSISGDWADTGSFTELAALGPDKIVYTTGDKFQIRAEADAKTLDKLRFKLENGKLLIGQGELRLTAKPFDRPGAYGHSW